jgi:hypothetical protein
MNHKIITGLALAGCLAVAPAANALPLVDFGVGAGQISFENDDSGAIAAHGKVDVTIPATPFSIEGMLSQTVSDGEAPGYDYNGNQLGAFAVFTTPTPMVKVRAKLGATRSDYEFENTSPLAQSGEASDTNLSYGVGVQLSDWQFEWTRTELDVQGTVLGTPTSSETYIDYLSVTLNF